MELPYAPYYCEENAYRIAGMLADGLLGGGPACPALVIVVTNEARASAHFAQKAASGGGAVLWDYHAFAAADGGSGWAVWDPSSRLACPVPAGEYLDATYGPVPQGPYSPLFRMVPAKEYLRRFSSDRRHMRRPDGGWLAPPPPWPPVRGPEASAAHALDALIDLGDHSWGEAMGLAELRSALGLTTS